MSYEGYFMSRGNILKSLNLQYSHDLIACDLPPHYTLVMAKYSHVLEYFNSRAVGTGTSFVT
jgi:hypothetical protein